MPLLPCPGRSGRGGPRSSRPPGSPSGWRPEMVAPRRRPSPRHDGGVASPPSRFLCASALGGFVGTLLITLGALSPKSPFASDADWPFPLPRSVVASQWVGILLVYAGIVIVLGAWYATSLYCARHPEQPLRPLVLVLVAWLGPLLFAPPLFSRDVFAYAALGQLVARG